MNDYEGLILQPTYRVRGGTPVVQLYGRLVDGPPFLIEDDRFRPYFFVYARDAHRLAGEAGVQIHTTALHDLHGEAVARVVVPVPGAVRALRDRLERDGVRPLEADIRFPYRYLIDHDIHSLVSIEGEGAMHEGGLLCFRNPELRPGQRRPRLVRLSLDLETSLDAREIFSAAVVCDGGDRDPVAEVHIVGTSKIQHPSARIYESERDLLPAVCKRIRELDPDLIVGWNVVDFDLRVLTRRCEELALLPRDCRLGRANGPVTFQQDRGFTRQSRADVVGRMVLDGIPMVRDAMRLEDYRLETVAQAVLGRGKLIDQDAPDAGAEIQRLYREEPDALVTYNLEDARLVLDILDHEGLLDLALERSVLSGMQLDRVGASIASFDRQYLPELRRRGVVAPSVDTSRKAGPVQGGALLDPRPGLTSNVAVFDFKSLYPSLIRTFNLDPLALALAQTGDGDPIVAPNGARFSRKQAILPTIIERFMRSREEAKERGDRHADQAVKIMMNAMFGVFAASACRFFDPEVANAITGFGQQTLKWTADAFREEGIEVVYGDTDSVFVALDLDRDAMARHGDDERAASLARAAELRERIEDRITERIRAEYQTEPLLSLELEHVFDLFFLPQVRGGRGGSKKRYAGWLGGRLEIVGLESVRRDWPAITARLQKGMLTRLFTGDDVMPFVKRMVDDLRDGKLDDDLIYVKRIRKGSLDSYTASTPPHIQAARKLSGPVGPIVRYVVTNTGPEPVLPGRPLPGGIDHHHYVDKVLRPVADAILIELGHSFDEAMGNPTQLSLL